MSGRQLHSLGLVLVLAAVLGFAGVQPGAAQARNPAPVRQAGVLEQAWDWLAGLLGRQAQVGSHGLAQRWVEVGIGSDSKASPTTLPSGGSTVNGDIGPGLDPDGGH